MAANKKHLIKQELKMQVGRGERIIKKHWMTDDILEMAEQLPEE